MKDADLLYLKTEETGHNNAIEPTGNSLWCFSVRRLWPGRLMASVRPRNKTALKLLSFERLSENLDAKLHWILL